MAFCPGDKKATTYFFQHTGAVYVMGPELFARNKAAFNHAVSMPLGAGDHGIVLLFRFETQT